MAAKKHFEKLLAICIELGASDLHLSCDEPASYRVDGKLSRQNEVPIPAAEVGAMIQAIMKPHQLTEFDARWTVDLGYSAASGERFRVNCYREMGNPALAIRHLNQDLLSFEDLKLPVSLKALAQLRSGLILVTGVTGSGKSTTLAALLDEINRNRSGHILTVEDPVEFVHKNQKCLVHHREVHTDVPTFSDAVRAGLREDPDVIMVGEMRDLETMRAAMIAAETGHLVLSTLHTGTAVGAVERFIGAFLGEEQALARHRFSLILRGVVAQHLVTAAHGRGRIPALELLKNSHAVSNLIRLSKSEQIHSLMEAGAGDGMWTLDQYLAQLVKNKKITKQSAHQHCVSADNLKSYLSEARAGGVSRWQ